LLEFLIIAIPQAMQGAVTALNANINAALFVIMKNSFELLLQQGLPQAAATHSHEVLE
jgi:hypothetical protein